MTINEVKNESIKAIAAGLSISLGGFVFLSLRGGLFGALFFSIGLLVICIYGLNLYTGKICYICEKTKPIEFYGLVLILNIITAWLCGAIIGAISPKCETYAKEITEAKLQNDGVTIFILGIICNVLIYIAVESFKRCGEGMLGAVIVIMCVSIFILIGSEHCIANSFYFAAAGQYNVSTLLFLLINILGNTAGGIWAWSVYKSR